ncbi:hypothetical protein [Pseudogulbenkiania sp. MAI-1]|uniref:hypothetical protein n=1 Tax=Pseudogulbenkiania sp. MAI-1 TaxID=990370 RepID=UPI00045EBD9B|nr:hypothetical protein [Pseudogulbenkiania sp. MAI-1]
MSGLPTLATASFDADLPLSCLPLAETAYQGRLDRETRLALQLLASPVELPDDADPLLLRLEAKIDLTLELVLASRYPERPPITPCRLGLDAVAWRSATAHAVGEQVLLTLYPNSDSALILRLAGRIVDCQPAHGQPGFLLQADIKPSFDKTTHLQWEKWVFRRHRRAIQER